MKLAKLVNRFLSEPVEVRFEEVRQLLEAFEFVEYGDEIPLPSDALTIDE